MPDTIDLVVPNVVEFNLKRELLDFDPGVENDLVEHGTGYTDQCVFWSAGDRVLVLPAGYSQEWLTHVHAGLGSSVPDVISPLPRTGRLIRDLLDDDRALAALAAATDGVREVRLLSFGASPDLYSLASVLRSQGREVRLDVAGPEHYWSYEYLESKLCCVDLASHIPGFRVPRGISVTSWEQLKGAVTTIVGNGGRAVVKSMYGVGGYGSAVARGDADGTVRRFWQTLRREPFFGTFPLTVQDYIAHGTDCPAVDVLVDEGAVPRMEYSMLGVDGLRYRSLALGPGVLDPDLEERLAALGTAVHTFAQSLGYRGWMTVDCLRGLDDALYVTEINARRSGAMHAVALAERWADEVPVAYVNDALPLRLSGPVSYEEHIRPVFDELWARGVRAYPSTVRALTGHRPSLGIVVCARSAADGERIATEAHRAVNAAVTAAGTGQKRAAPVG
ncbi:hypothetical protein GT044_37235 [Streptomyces sp. SID335]|uniref:hypothetical protein n=1 Tax=unclassified Streptomyces TaxID=2593676 RepID=UPI00136C9890|nr:MULTISPECIES: hypothetical protein [unclassified Streptomyces]MYY86829.1 hypothetical protein [Streptomyces sp. SID335]NDZ88813.1 hypothetical protein [Streptomyces sp. SID10115]NDZ99649.1 hypothetical protein [Streptomyces sp. SID10116]NEB46043.1 hypothetical protein [Streptomyces sp. SID339]